MGVSSETGNNDLSLDPAARRSNAAGVRIEYGAIMATAVNHKPSDDPHDIVVVAPDPAPTAPTDDELSRLARSLRHSALPTRPAPEIAAAPIVTPVEPLFRPTPVVVATPGRARSMGARAARAFAVTLLLAAAGGAAKFGWQSYGDTAQRFASQWAPTFGGATSPAAVAAAPPAAPSQGDAAGNAAITDVNAPTAAPSADPAQASASAPNEIAGLRQQIETLKASIEELKSGQQQMSRDLAKVSDLKASEIKPPETRPAATKPSIEARASDQTLQPAPPAQPRRAAVPKPRKPISPVPQQAAYPATAYPPPTAPYAARQIDPPLRTSPNAAASETLTDPELASVPRPPMPLH